MAAPPKVAEIPDLEVDPITLDIIENALRHARFEMDAVLFRSAMSPVIREQHDEFPMLTDPQGRMVVGPVRRLHQRDDGRLGPRHLPGRRDPHLRPVQVQRVDLAHERLARAGADLLRGRARGVVVAVRSPDGRRRAPAGVAADGRDDDLRGGDHHPAAEDRRARRGAGGRPAADPQQRPPAGDEPRRPVRDRRRLPRRRAARDRPLRALRQGRLPGHAAGAAGPHARGDAQADPARDPGGAADLRGLDRRRRARQRPVQDEADDLARGGGGLVRLVGHRPAVARADQLLPLRGHVQDVHRGLPDHGQRPRHPVQRRLLSAAARRDARGLPALAAAPGGAGLSHARAGAAVRRARRGADQAGAGAQHRGGLRHVAVHAVFGLEGFRGVLLRDGDPVRRDPGPADRRRHGRALVVAAVREHPDRVPRGLLSAARGRLHDGDGLRRRRLPPRRQRRREALRVPRAGARVDPRRPLADAAVGRARRPAGGALDEDPAPRGRPRRCCRPSATRSRSSRATC